MGIRNVLPGGQGISTRRAGADGSSKSSSAAGTEEKEAPAKTTGAAFGSKGKPAPLARPAGLGPGPGLVTMKVEGIPDGALKGSAADEKSSEKAKCTILESTMSKCWEGYTGEAKLRQIKQDEDKLNPKKPNNLSGHMLAVAAILVLYVFLMVGVLHKRVQPAQSQPLGPPQTGPSGPGFAPAPWDRS